MVFVNFGKGVRGCQFQINLDSHDSHYPSGRTMEVCSDHPEAHLRVQDPTVYLVYSFKDHNVKEGAPLVY